MGSVLTTVRRKRPGIILIFRPSVSSIANTTASHFDRYESRASTLGPDAIIFSAWICYQSLERSWLRTAGPGTSSRSFCPISEMTTGC